MTEYLLPLVVTEDNRLAGSPRLIFHPRGQRLMQVPPGAMKSVAFLACKRPSGYRECGTVFFVSQPLPGIEMDTSYAITARHLIDGIRKAADDFDNPGDGATHIRMNTPEHGFKYIEMPHSEWITNPHKHTDVAVAPIDLDDPGFAHDHLTIGRSMFVKSSTIHNEGVGPGDNLFFPGLFSHYKGKKANVPIIRIGTIAAMPDEPIETKFGEIKGYLAEARSIRGLSGSPVFLDIRIPEHRFRPDTPRIAEDSQHRIHFFGLVHGHWDAQGILDYDEDIDLTKAKRESEPLNTGIAIIIPANEIESVLDLPQLVAMRESEAAYHIEQAKKLLPTED